MSYLSTEKFLAVGRLIAMELNRLPVKRAAAALDTSDVTVKKMRRGELPNAVTLLRAIENFGLKILEPVLGPSDNASLARRLDLILAEVGDLKNVVSPAVSQASDNLLGAGVGTREGAVECAGTADEKVRSGLALVTRRLPLDAAGRSEALRRRLSFSNVSSLDEARNVRATARNLGLAWRRPGEEWTVDPADDNRFWRGLTGPLPLTAFPSPEYVEGLRRGFDEALSEGAVMFQHTGFLDGEHIHATVARLGAVANDGTQLVLAPFDRRVA